MPERNKVPSEPDEIVLAQFERLEGAAGEGKQTEVIIDPDAHRSEADQIVEKHGGVEVDLPNE